MPTPSLQRRPGSRQDRWRVRWQSGATKVERTFPSYDEAQAYCSSIGNPAGRRAYRNDRERIELNVLTTETGCWNWQLYLDADHGYGYVTVGGRCLLAHRLSYEVFVGPIPEGLQLDHLCRNRACVNPAHLEPVTARTNIMRSPVAQAALNAAKTHCPEGHPYDEGNTIRQTRGGRCCRACQSSRARRVSSAVAR